MEVVAVAVVAVVVVVKLLLNIMMTARRRSEVGDTSVTPPLPPSPSESALESTLMDTDGVCPVPSLLTGLAGRRSSISILCSSATSATFSLY